MSLTFYMKSGSVIVQRGVSDYEFKQDGENITYLRIDYRKWLKPRIRLLIPSIDLNQIEAIVRS